jgi:hypothetical protein
MTAEFVNRLKEVTRNLWNAIGSVIGWMKAKWRVILKTSFSTIQIITLILVGLGWYMDHALQSQWVVKLFAPRYERALALYNGMLRSPGAQIDVSTPGFAEISLILSGRIAEQLPQVGDFAIDTIRVTGVMAMVISSDPSRSGPRLTLQIAMQDGRVLQEVEVGGNWLKSEIQERFLEEPLFTWAERFQWLGIVVALATLILEKVFKLA